MDSSHINQLLYNDIYIYTCIIEKCANISDNKIGMNIHEVIVYIVIVINTQCCIHYPDT